VGGTPQRCMSRGIWRTGFHSGGRLRAYALSDGRARCGRAIPHLRPRGLRPDGKN